MSYRNKTYVAFASEDIGMYLLMEAWKTNKHIDFNFFDAHDFFISRDTSKPETIKLNLIERLKKAKQVALLGSEYGKINGGNGASLLAHEIEAIIELNLPIVVVNVDQPRNVYKNYIPDPLLNTDYYTVSVSYQPKIIMHALSHYVADFTASDKNGPHQYPSKVYSDIGL
jgi:hypothetical protein